MTSYFEDFNKSMKKRPRIPISLVEKHFNDVFFLVDTDFTYVQAVGNVCGVIERGGVNQLPQKQNHRSLRCLIN